MIVLSPHVLAKCGPWVSHINIQDRPYHSSYRRETWYRHPNIHVLKCFDRAALAPPACGWTRAARHLSLVANAELKEEDLLFSHQILLYLGMYKKVLEQNRYERSETHCTRPGVHSGSSKSVRLFLLACFQVLKGDMPVKRQQFLKELRILCKFYATKSQSDPCWDPSSLI